MKSKFYKLAVKMCKETNQNKLNGLLRAFIYLANRRDMYAGAWMQITEIEALFIFIHKNRVGYEWESVGKTFEEMMDIFKHGKSKVMVSKVMIDKDPKEIPDTLVVWMHEAGNQLKLPF